MLARITGVLELVEAEGALIALPDVGLAYEALLPAYLAGALAPRIGERITLHTLEHIEGASAQGASLTPRLLGFASRQERAFFRALTKVRGLGARRALRAMAAPPEEIAGAIARGDSRFLQSLPEIGKRLAETIIADLQGKVAPFAPAGAAEGGRGPSSAIEPKLAEPAEQAAGALVRLGQTRAEAERAVRGAIEANPDLSTADEILAAAFGGR